MTMQGKLIVEIAELASFRKSENEEIKAFITRQVDEYRPPYGRTVTRRPSTSCWPARPTRPTRAI